jgi:hypothetical protein
MNLYEAAIVRVERYWSLYPNNWDKHVLNLGMRYVETNYS